MSQTNQIEFDTPSEHQYDSTKISILNGQAKLISLVSPSELLFFNFDDISNPSHIAGADVAPKRGSVNLTLPDYNIANPNVGVINNNWLTFETATYSFGIINNLAKIASSSGNNPAFRTKIRVNAATYGTPWSLLTITNNENSAKIRIYLENQGGGVTRVRGELLDNTGASIYAGIIGTKTFSIDDIMDIGFSRNDAGGYYFMLDGVIVGDLTATIKFDTMNIEIGGPYSNKTHWDYDDLQFWNGDERINLSYDGISLESITYSINEEMIATTMPLLLDEIISFEAQQDVVTNTNVGYILMKNTDLYYFNTTSSEWELSNGTLALSNTDQEINDNVTTFPVAKHVGAYIQVIQIIKSDTGYHTPTIEGYTFKYTFEFQLASVSTCSVYGEVRDNSGVPVVGAVVEFDSTNKIYNNAMIFPKAKTLTNALGKWSLRLVETETQNASGTFIITYDNDGDEEQQFYKNKIIPNFPTKKFEDLLDDA